MNELNVSIIGAGSFGTAISQQISQNVENVYLFGRNNNLINSINKKHINNIYHPLTSLNDNIYAYNILKDKNIINQSDLLIFCIPSGSIREVSRELSNEIKNKLIITTSKGIEYPSLKQMTQIIKEEVKTDTVFCISGPTFADELLKGFISGVTIGVDHEYKKDITRLLDSPNLLIDSSNDVMGVEICGVLKNIYAVAMGILDNYFQGFNEHHTILNMCFKEMVYLLEGFGHYNLSNKFCAFGDFNLTANVDKSRNRTLGQILGKNIALDLNRSSITIESLKSIKAIKYKADKFDLDAPIVEFVNLSINEPSNILRNLNHFIQDLKKKDF